MHCSAEALHHQPADGMDDTFAMVQRPGTGVNTCLDYRNLYFFSMLNGVISALPSISHVWQRDDYGQATDTWREGYMSMVTHTCVNGRGVCYCSWSKITGTHSFRYTGAARLLLHWFALHVAEIAPLLNCQVCANRPASHSTGCGKQIGKFHHLFSLVKLVDHYVCSEHRILRTRHGAMNTAL